MATGAGPRRPADRLELELVGWGRDEESWSCDYRVLWGDPSNPTLWAELEQFLTATFEHETLAEGMHIDATCTEPDVPALTPEGTTRRPRMPFAEERNASATLAPLAIKGVGGRLSAKRPIWPKRPSKAAKGKVNLFVVGVDASKEAVFARLKREDSGAGYCHFPLDRDAAYFEQLTAERLRTRYVKGFAQQFWWKPDGRRNEALDCRVYAYAALHGLFSMGLNLNKRVAELPVIPLRRQETSISVTAPASDSPRRRRRAISSRYM